MVVKQATHIPLPRGPIQELGRIANHAGVVLTGQLAVMAFGVTDTVVAGRFSETALAALSVGAALYVSVYVGLMGVLQALMPVWAELHGAQRRSEVGPSVRQALYLCLFTIIIGMAALLWPGPILRATGVPAELQIEVARYLSVLAWALPPALFFRLFSTLNQSLGHPRLVSVLQVGALLPKVLLSIWLTFGGAGLEPQGVAGCAWATLIVNYALFAVALKLLRSGRFYQPYGIWRRMEPPDWRQIGTFARLGVPAGLAVMVEVTSFALMALFIARLGNLSAASHQIASNLAAVLYMVPLALGIATSARVSYWLGAGQRAEARRAALLGLGAAGTLAICLITMMTLFARPLVSLYVDEPAIVMTASALLAWVAIYHLGDALQAVSVFVLRSYRIVLVPLLIYCVLLWGGGLAGGYYLAFHGLGSWPPMSTPDAFWIAGASALSLVAAIFLAMVWRAARKA